MTRHLSAAQNFGKPLPCRPLPSAFRTLRVVHPNTRSAEIFISLDIVGIFMLNLKSPLPVEDPGSSGQRGFQIKGLHEHDRSEESR
jgi:hypothetical protein